MEILIAIGVGTGGFYCNLVINVNTAFYILSFLTVFFVLLMILQKNPVGSALSLVLSFFSLAGLYVLLEAHFVAAVQILVYAGAIMVLFIFVIMLLNLKDDELVSDKLNFKRVTVFFIGMALFVFLALRFAKIPAGAFTELSSDFGTAKAVAKLMFTTYVVPFEVIGVLLLVGIVGAIVLGSREDES